MNIFYARLFSDSTSGGRWLAPLDVQRSSINEIDGDDAASCAENYCHRNVAWEDSWPITFAIFNGLTGPEIGRWEVFLEMEPSFHAVQKQGDA